MVLVLPSRLIIAALVVRFVREAVAASGIAAGAMTVAGGIVIHPVIIANATVLAGAMIATVIVTAYTSSRAVAARTTKEEKSSDFAALFHQTDSACEREMPSSCGNTSAVMGARTSITSPPGAKSISHFAFNSPARTE